MESASNQIVVDDNLCGECGGCVPICEKVTVYLTAANLRIAYDRTRMRIRGNMVIPAESLISGGSLEKYSREFKRMKWWELRAYKLLKPIFVRATDNDFDKIIDAIGDLFPEKQLSNLSFLNLAFRLVFRNPGLIRLARYGAVG